MKPRVLIAHARTEENRAEELAAPIVDAGYDVVHRGTILVGTSVVREVSAALEQGAPVVVCGTVVAIGTGWARKVVEAARARGVRVFVVQIEEDADVEGLAFGEKFARYWEDSHKATSELIVALRTHYPIGPEDGTANGTETTPPATTVTPTLSDQELLVDYLAALVREINHLRPGRIRKINLPLELVLDDIYVELEAVPERPDVDRRVTLEELAEARQRVENWDWQDDRDREQQLKLYADLDRSFRENIAQEAAPEDLAAIIERHPQVVILGEPGSGKTTLLKHLALKSAHAILALPEPLPAGPARVPLLIRISEYAECRARTSPDLALGEYLASHVAGLQTRASDAVTALLRRLLDEGRCISLLDGLDEVIDDSDRVNVADAIAQFAAVFRDKGPDGPGNSFVVTSRIAGYRPFINLPSAFGEYTIRPMRQEQIEQFLERWCPAIERQVQEGAEPEQIELHASREKELILEAISTAPGVRRLADNPLLLRILAMLHRSEGRLPQRRAEVYREATEMLLHDWHLERRAPKGVAIDDVVALRLLGPVAMHIHTHQPSGFMSLGETEQLLCRIRAPELGDPPDQPSVETIQAVRKFLKTVREHSGLFVERGTGLFGFMHLTFQEYFVARHLLSFRDKARYEIKARLHEPRWREPILLAISSVNQPFTNDIKEYLDAILDAGSEHEAILHRDLLFAAECVGDCVGVPELLRREIARRLITVYCDSRQTGRYALLRHQIRNALGILNDSSDSWVVQAALADVLERCDERADISRGLELVELLQVSSQAVADALNKVPDLHLLPDVRVTLKRIEARARAETEAPAARPATVGWGAYRDEPMLARTIGALWLYGWHDFVELGLGVPDEILRGGDAEDANGLWSPLTRLRQLAWHLEVCVTGPGDNSAGVLRELDAITRTMITDSDGGESSLSAARFLVSVQRWYRQLATQTSRFSRRLAFMLDSLTLASADGFDAEDPDARGQVAAELLSGLYALGRGHQPTQGQKRRFRAKARRLAELADIGDLPAQLFALVSAPRNPPSDNDLKGRWRYDPNVPQRDGGSDESVLTTDPAFHQLAVAVGRLEELLEAEVHERLENWGRAVLRHAQFCDALAPTIADAIRQAVPLKPSQGGDGWRDAAEAAGTAVIDAATNMLQTSHNPRQYLQAAFLLARAGDHPRCEQALQAVLADLNADENERRLLALHTLQDPAVRRRLDADSEADNPVRARLTELAELAARHPDVSARALDVLFDLGLTPRLLAWCWATLRRGDPAMSELLPRHLDAVWTVEGTTPFLELLDDGFADDTTRPLARKLLLRLSWSGTETYVQCLAWLSAADAQTRHLAAIALAQNALLTVPRAVLRDATRAQLDAMVRPLRVSWAGLKDEPEVVRLFHALWTHGWRDALARLWLDQTAQPYLEEKYPAWCSKEGDGVIRWFLEQARFGPTLIPLFTNAAAELAKRERKRGGGRPADPLAAPHHEDLGLVERHLLEELEVAAESRRDHQSHSPGPLETDAAILLAALRQTPVRRPSTATLWRILEGGPDGEWFWAAARLASMPSELTALQEALTASLEAAEPHRFALVLLLLCADQELWDAMRGALADRLRQGVPEQDEVLFHARLVLAIGPPPALVSGASAVSSRAHEPLSQQAPEAVATDGELDGGTSIATIAHGLLAKDPRTRAVAAARLLDEDLYTRLLPVLVEAAVSGEDRVRWSGKVLLEQVCRELPTDGSTAAVGWLYGYHHELLHGRANGEPGGYQGTVMREATAWVHHAAPHWAARWLDLVEHGAEPERRAASTALQLISQASDDVVGWLCAKLDDAPPDAVREAATSALEELRLTSQLRRSDPVITNALVKALHDPAPRVRRFAAHALQWTDHESEMVGGELLKLAKTDQDIEARRLALLSLGRWLRRVEHPKAGDVPDHPVLSKMMALLSAPEAAIGRAAAAGIAAAVEGREDSLAVLSGILSEPSAVLTAALTGGADVDWWGDASDRDTRRLLVEGLAAWLYDRPTGERDGLVDRMLSDLERAAAGMETAVNDDEIDDPPWAYRRIITAVLAELSERLTHRSFAPTRPLDEVVALFARVARDPDSFSARRFSLRILGTLQQFTPQVATAFFEACRDVSSVYQETTAIIRKFKTFTPGCFQNLTTELFDPANDAFVACHAATLLGELGLSRSEELGSSGRMEIGAQLAHFLQSPLAERTVVELEDPDGAGVREAGSLYDAVYEALVRVVAGPDAPFSVAADASGADSAETVWRQQRDESSEQLQAMLERFEERDVPTEAEIGRPNVRLIWREGSGENYSVSIIGATQWFDNVSHRFDGGYLRLIVEPRQGHLPFTDGAIVISRGADLARRPGKSGPGWQAILGDPGARVLHETRLGSKELVIGIPQAMVGEISYIDLPDQVEVILEARGAAQLVPEDLVVPPNSLYVSFPYWEGEIDKVSYTLEEGRLNIIVTPGEEGLKLRNTDVVFSRGARIPIMPAAHIGRLRRRKGRTDVRLIVSVPAERTDFEEVSYQLDESYLHIIVRPSDPFRPFDRDDVRITISADIEEPQNPA